MIMNTNDINKISPIVDQVAKTGSAIKKTIIIIIVAVAVIALLIIALKLGLFSKDRKLQIDETANVIDEIKKIGEFTSLCYYEEMALIDTKERQTKLTKSDVTDELVLIAHGKMRAGFNLSKLNDKDILITGDTLSIRLPEPEIFDIIVNPSDYEIFVETGKWSHEQFAELQKQAKQILNERAEELNIAEKAGESGIKKLETLFKTFGFSEVFFLPIN